MPPKNAPSKNKKEEKKKQEALKDKTFGMKNKKLRAQIEKNIMGGASKQYQQQSKKKEEEDLKDMSKIFKPVAQVSNQKVSADVDPKSVLCVFFKQGMCTKGNKCKFSHDLSTQQKTAKKNLYVDSRDLSNEKNIEETNENWDEKTLQDVAEKKHGEKDRKRPNQTDIVCKYFLEAVENAKYGWFWECPNGADACIYRHALPPGYILKKDRKKMEEQNRLSKITLEEYIENERTKLIDKELTKITAETFLQWKKRKMREKKQAKMQSEKNKLATFKAGKQTGLSGRELFTFNPDFIAESNNEAKTGADGGDEEGDVAQYEREGSDDGEADQMQAFEIDDRTFQAMDEEGNFVESDENEEEPSAQKKTNELIFNEDLFDEEHLPTSSDEDEDGVEEEQGTSQGITKQNVDDGNSLCEKLNKI